jgi:hypothetical protein
MRVERLFRQVLRFLHHPHHVDCSRPGWSCAVCELLRCVSRRAGGGLPLRINAPGSCVVAIRDRVYVTSTFGRTASVTASAYCFDRPLAAVISTRSLSAWRIAIHAQHLDEHRHASIDTQHRVAALKAVLGQFAGFGGWKNSDDFLTKHMEVVQIIFVPPPAMSAYSAHMT